MIGVLIPTQHKRDNFLEQSMKMLEGQTRQPDNVMVMDWVHDFDSPIDLNWRYVDGLMWLFNHGCKQVILWEEDDYYKPDYIEKMMASYESVGSPDLFGLSNTIYYHLGIRRYAMLEHKGHSSAMSMIVSNKILTHGIPDRDKYDFDIFYSRRVKNAVFVRPVDTRCISIKHGIASCGTMGHKKEAKIYYENTTNSICKDDKDLLYLKQETGLYFDFYKTLFT